MEVLPLALLALSIFLGTAHCQSSHEQLELAGNISYPRAKVGPYDWDYFTADVPQSTAELQIRFHRYWDDTASEAPGPVVCFSVGGPTVPPEPLVKAPTLTSAAQAAALSLGASPSAVHNVTAAAGNCAVFWEHDTVTLRASTMDAVSSLGGRWYVGVFSRADSSRFQSQMIARGDVYSFDISFALFQCPGHSLGLLCSQPVTELPLSPLAPLPAAPDQAQGPPGAAGRVLSTGWRQLSSTCLVAPPPGAPPSEGPSAAFSLRLDAASSLVQFSLEADPAQSLASLAWSALSAMQGGAARLNATLLHAGALPARRMRLSLGPEGATRDLDAGEWLLVVGGAVNGVTASNAPADKLCFSLKWRVDVCQPGWAGPQCQHPLHALQRLIPPWQPESELDSVYSPPSRVVWPPQIWTSWFPLPPPSLAPANASTLVDPRSAAAPSAVAPAHPASPSVPALPSVSASAASVSAGSGWVYLSLDVPRGATGGVLTIDAESPASSLAALSFPSLFGNSSSSSSSSSSASLNLTLLGRVRAVPSADVHDFSASGNLLQGQVSVDVLYPMEGRWYLGLRVAPSAAVSPAQAEQALASLQLRLTLHGCPHHCSWHGSCRASFDAAHQQPISFCYCDRTHGGQDCSVALQTEKQHKLAVYFLVISNAASALPSIWAYQHQAYAEWVVYSSAGAVSALYHSCDAGSWCAAGYGTLQFADFFLSFLAVLATFVFCAGLPPRSKLAFSLSVAILAAVIARDNTTSGWNLIVVIGLGASGLLLGWLLAFFPGCRGRHRVAQDSHALDRAQPRLSCWAGCARAWSSLVELVKTIWLRFDKRYLAAALAVLGLAGFGWFTETGQTYWIWHSVFHVCIFSSAFLFLNSVIDREDIPEYQVAPKSTVYEEHIQGFEHELEEGEPEGEEAMLVKAT